MLYTNLLARTKASDHFAAPAQQPKQLAQPEVRAAADAAEPSTQSNGASMADDELSAEADDARDASSAANAETAQPAAAEAGRRPDTPPGEAEGGPPMEQQPAQPVALRPRGTEQHAGQKRKHCETEPT